MHGLPKNFDGSFLLGQILEMICFNATQLYLHFSNQIILTIEGSFAYDPNGSQGTQVIYMPVKNSSLMQLLEHSVIKVSGDGEGTLTLVFENGDVFKCFDSSKNYESYQIKYGQQVIIV